MLGTSLEGAPVVVVREADLVDPEAALAPDERAQHDAFPVAKRRREWILGRVAAKAAVARALELATGEVVSPASLRIGRGPEGEPRAERLGPGDRREALPLGLSLSHGHGQAVAWALAGGLPGVDVEQVRPRPEGTFRFYLDPEERAPLLALAGGERDAAAVVLWSLKEAAWKTLRPHRGVGLFDFRVAAGDLRADSGSATFAFRNGAIDLARERGVSGVRASWVRAGDLVVAWAEAR